MPRPKKPKVKTPPRVAWERRPTSVPLPGREPYACDICRERVEPGQAIRWSSSRKKAAHDTCAKALGRDGKEREPKPRLYNRRSYPIGGEMDLARWPDEPTLQHRALLLYAMQHPSKRSQKCVSRALGRVASISRFWSTKWHWIKRSSGVRSDADAVILYRQLYLKDFGATELPEIADRVVVPLDVTNEGVPPSDLDTDLRDADNLVRDEILRKRSAEKSIRDRHVKIVDGGLSYVVSELQKGNIRASLRDIPILIEARALLSGEVGGEMVSKGGAMVESVRVRLAREAGRDIVDALAEDLDELQIIVKSLQVRRESIDVPIRIAMASGGPPIPVALHVVADAADEEEPDDVG